MVRAGRDAGGAGDEIRRRSRTELEDKPLQGTSGSAGASRRSARALQRGSGVQGGRSTSGGEKLGRRPLTCSSAPGRFGREQGRDREGLARGWSWTRAKLLRRLAVTGAWWCGGTAAAPRLGTAGQGERRARVLEWRRRWARDAGGSRVGLKEACRRSRSPGSVWKVAGDHGDAARQLREREVRGWG